MTIRAVATVLTLPVILGSIVQAIGSRNYLAGSVLIWLAACVSDMFCPWEAYGNIPSNGLAAVLVTIKSRTGLAKPAEMCQ